MKGVRRRMKESLVVEEKELLCGEESLAKAKIILIVKTSDRQQDCQGVQMEQVLSMPLRGPSTRRSRRVTLTNSQEEEEE